MPYSRKNNDEDAREKPVYLKDRVEKSWITRFIAILECFAFWVP
jgi:hypothetical protein